MYTKVEHFIQRTYEMVKHKFKDVVLSIHMVYITMCSVGILLFFAIYDSRNVSSEGFMSHDLFSLYEKFYYVWVCVLHSSVHTKHIFCLVVYVGSSKKNKNVNETVILCNGDISGQISFKCFFFLCYCWTFYFPGVSNRI